MIKSAQILYQPIKFTKRYKRKQPQKITANNSKGAAIALPLFAIQEVSVLLESLEAVAPLVSSVGFPVVVALYFMIRMERKLDELSATISELMKAISKII